MKCLIIAAGKGSRLWRKGKSKPLIERVIRYAIQAGEVTASRLILCRGCNNDGRKYENSAHLFGPLTVAAGLRVLDKVKLL